LSILGDSSRPRVSRKGRRAFGKEKPFISIKEKRRRRGAISPEIMGKRRRREAKKGERLFSS